jgi:ABC-type Na+ efflux pump permease subunit
MYRTWVIVRHTFREAVVQPIYSLLLALGTGILTIFGMLPFFTLGEDTIMFKSVGLDVILILVLISTLFATSKSIYEEIEDRTMLTLMSKPVAKWEVLVGKYLGLIGAALLAVVVLGSVLILATYLRIPTDYQLRANSLDERDIRRLFEYRLMHVSGLVPSLVLSWLQISTLAAISVAISTRVSLVVNLPVVILLYIAGNLTRFFFPLAPDDSAIVKGAAYVFSTIIPYLATFDLRSLTVLGSIGISGTGFAQDPRAVSLGTIWSYVSIAALYGVAYSVFALSAGMWLFQNRELGGGEG